MVDTLATNIVAALVFALLGILVFFGAFALFDRLTPYKLWKEIIDDQNVALAVLIGALGLGISIIVAAAIH